MKQTFPVLSYLQNQTLLFVRTIGIADGLPPLHLPPLFVRFLQQLVFPKPAAKLLYEYTLNLCEHLRALDVLPDDWMVSKAAFATPPTSAMAIVVMVLKICYGLSDECNTWDASYRSHNINTNKQHATTTNLPVTADIEPAKIMYDILPTFDEWIALATEESRSTLDEIPYFPTYAS